MFIYVLVHIQYMYVLTYNINVWTLFYLQLC